jgi:hypothetical protein
MFCGELHRHDGAKCIFYIYRARNRFNWCHLQRRPPIYIHIRYILLFYKISILAKKSLACNKFMAQKNDFFWVVSKSVENLKRGQYNIFLFGQRMQLLVSARIVVVQKILLATSKNIICCQHTASY